MAVTDPRAYGRTAVGRPLRDRAARSFIRDVGVRGARRRIQSARALAAGHAVEPALGHTAFACQVRRGAAAVRVTGDLDMASRDGLFATIKRYAHDDRVHDVIVDLAGVSFLDCAGLSALLAGRRAAVECRRAFTIVNPRPPVVRLLQLTGTSEILGMPGRNGS